MSDVKLEFICPVCGGETIEEPRLHRGQVLEGVETGDGLRPTFSEAHYTGITFLCRHCGCDAIPAGYRWVATTNSKRCITIPRSEFPAQRSLSEVQEIFDELESNGWVFQREEYFGEDTPGGEDYHEITFMKYFMVCGKEHSVCIYVCAGEKWCEKENFAYVRGAGYSHYFE